MARFNLSFLAVFLTLALCALSLPTKRDNTNGLNLNSALEDLQSLTKLMHGHDNKDNNDQNNEAHQKKATTGVSDKDSRNSGGDNADKEPTRTHKKPTSGNFVTPTATNTHHPTSQPNMLGKLPLVGGLLGGTGGSL